MAREKRALYVDACVLQSCLVLYCLRGVMTVYHLPRKPMWLFCISHWLTSQTNTNHSTFFHMLKDGGRGLWCTEYEWCCCVWFFVKLCFFSRLSTRYLVCLSLSLSLVALFVK